MCWFCLLLLAGCAPDAAPDSQWEGTYIGYIHHNQQDTTPVTLVFEGKYFAAAPYGTQNQFESTGVFKDDRSALFFENTAHQAQVNLNGEYKYSFGPDGSVRMWQENGTEKREMILRQK